MKIFENLHGHALCLKEVLGILGEVLGILEEVLSILEEVLGILELAF